MKESRHSPAAIERILEANTEAIFPPNRSTSGEELHAVDILIKAKSIHLSSMFDACDKVGLKLSELGVVDIGCQRGDILLALRELGAKKLFGIDRLPFSPQWLKDPAQFYEFCWYEPGSVTFIQCDVGHEMLPFDDCSQSIVILTDVFEHLHNPANVLAEGGRVLREDGLLVIGTPNTASSRNRLCLLMGRSAYQDLDS